MVRRLTLAALIALTIALLWAAGNAARADAPPQSPLRALEPWLALEATIVKTTTLRYNAYDVAGEAAAPGSYAFLSEADGATNVVAAYEDLRNGTTAGCSSTKPTYKERRKPRSTTLSRRATSSSGTRPTTAGCATE